MLEILFWIAIALVAGPIVLTNVAGPFIVWKTQRILTREHFQPASEADFFSDVPQQHHDFNSRLKELDFEDVGSSVMTMSQVSAHFSLFVREDLQLAAMVTTMKSKVASLVYAEIAQRYENDTTLTVCNSPQAESYPAMEKKLVFRYPKITDVSELFNLHARLRSKYKVGLAAVRYKKENGFQDLENYILRESDDLVKLGICRREIDPDGRRRLTLRGAFMLTYKAAFPGNKLWNWITQKRAARALVST